MTKEESEIQRELLHSITKQIITRIKEVQQEIKEAYSQENVWIKQGIETELIGWKIRFEKWRKSLKQ